MLLTYGSVERFDRVAAENSRLSVARYPHNRPGCRKAAGPCFFSVVVSPRDTQSPLAEREGYPACCLTHAARLA